MIVLINGDHEDHQILPSLFNFNCLGICQRYRLPSKWYKNKLTGTNEKKYKWDYED